MSNQCPRIPRKNHSFFFEDTRLRNWTTKSVTHPGTFLFKLTYKQLIIFKLSRPIIKLKYHDPTDFYSIYYFTSMQGNIMASSNQPYLKVSKSRKQFLEFSILPKNKLKKKNISSEFSE